MSFDFDAPEEVEGAGGGFLKEAGTYHMAITRVHEGMTCGKTPKAIDGFSVEFDCLDGTVSDSAGKAFSESFFRPDLTRGQGSIDKAKRRMAAFFIATDLMTPEQLGKSGLKISLDDAAGRQVVIRLKDGMEADGDGNWTVPTGYLEIDYAAIYHVDDPDVKDIPKNADALEMIDKAQRHDVQYFAFKAKKGKGGQPASPKKQAASNAASEAADIF